MKRASFPRRGELSHSSSESRHIAPPSLRWDHGTSYEPHLRSGKHRRTMKLKMQWQKLVCSDLQLPIASCKSGPVLCFHHVHVIQAELLPETIRIPPIPMHIFILVQIYTPPSLPLPIFSPSIPSLSSSPSRNARLHLHPMPLLNPLSQHLINQPLLLQHSQPPKPLTLYLNRIHAPTPTTHILNLQPLRLQLSIQQFPNLRLSRIKM